MDEKKELHIIPLYNVQPHGRMLDLRFSRFKSEVCSSRISMAGQSGTFLKVLGCNVWVPDVSQCIQKLCLKLMSTGKTIHCSLVEAYNSNAKGLQSAHQLEPSYTFHVITLTARVARLKWLVPMHQAVPSTTGSSRRNNSVLQTFVQYFLQVLSMQTSAPQKLFFSDISWNPPTKDLRTLPSAEQGTSLIATIQSQKNLQGKALNWTDSIYLL